MANIFYIPKKVLETAGDTIELAVDKAGDGVEVLTMKAADAKERIDKARFGPVFDLDQINDNMPQVIFVEDNQRLKNIPACKGAIGFTEKLKGMSMMRLLPKYKGLPGIRFYPDSDGILYYQDPCDDHLYIDLNCYFDYLNAARIDEVMDVAQALGAKHVKIEQKEEKKCFVSPDAKAENPDECSSIAVLADEGFDASVDVPTLELKYLKQDAALNSLIQSCMNGEHSITKETYSIECKALDGLHLDDAEKLDAVIGALKLSGNTSVTSAAEAEERTVLEYTIEF